MPYVYKNAKSKFYQCEIWVDGSRVSRTTKRTSRREAEAAAAELQREVNTRAKAQAAAGTSLALNAVALRYMEDVGDHKVEATTIDSRVNYLVEHFGPGKLITEITHEDVQALINRRRIDKVPRTDRRIAPATVNATVQQLLKMFNYCRERRVVFPLEPVWRKLWLKVPRERERTVGHELRDEDVARLDATLRADYAPLFAFALLTGKRQSECVNLRWADVRFDTGVCEWKGKGGRLVRLQLTDNVRAILEPLRGHHTDKVFTYVAAMTRKPDRKGKGARVKGRRYPITLTGLRAMWWDLQPKAGLKHVRFHDFRHDVATRVLRKYGLEQGAKVLDL